MFPVTSTVREERESGIRMYTVMMEPTTHTMPLEGVASAMAVSRDDTQVVVAGRNIFKIYAIEATRFVEKLNLRVGKQFDHNPTCVDVAWNSVDDAVIATSSQGGRILTWNLNSTNKLDLTFQDHQRTVNKVCFHATEPHLLLSGSQDSTMKLYDLRAKEVCSTFYGLAESVRDVKFSPHQCFVYAAATDIGHMQFWDIRRTDRCERQFAAHTSQILTCNWHPEEKYVIATAGRDKMLKIWDTSFKEKLEKCIQTNATIHQVRWRPNKKFHIASAAMCHDRMLPVWDTRRSTIPCAMFLPHKDLPAPFEVVFNAFEWRTSNAIVACRKDSHLIQYAFKDAYRPPNHTKLVGLDVSSFGDVSLACNNKHYKDTIKNTRGPSHPRHMTSKKQTVMSDRSKTHISALYELRSAHESLSMEWFTETANRYLLHGKPLPELCDHNAQIAKQLSRHHVSQTWLILKLLYTSGSILVQNSLSDYSHLGQDKLQDEIILDNVQENSFKPFCGNGTAFRHNSGRSSSRHVSGGSAIGTNDGTHAEDDSDSCATIEHENTIRYFKSELTQGDFFFGGGDYDSGMLVDYSQISTLPSDEDWALPREAFNIRHALGDGSPPPELANAPSSPLCAAEELCERDYAPNEEDDQQSMMLALCNPPRFPSWDFSKLVVEMLEFYAEQGDVQMSVSVLLVLGDKISDAVPEIQQEHWFLSYIDLLGRFKLWNISNEVIALSNLPSVSSLNQQSTVMHALCGECGKCMNRMGWFCDNCKKMSLCSICHQIVRGVYAWCQGCAHGGHLLHMQEWFKQCQECPVGCGHLCQYV